MLSNKYILLILFILSAFSFYSCGGNKKEEKAKLIAKYKNPKYALAQVQKVLGNSVKFAASGKFNSNSNIEIAAGKEIKNSNEWGIKFYLLDLKDGNLVTSFQTKLLNGSFKKCLIQKIKFPWFNHELVYYNSQDYYMGSNGGEVFSYVIDFNTKQVYYAHLVAQQNMPVSLYLSHNIKVPGLMNFFISNFKRDFPKLALVQNDISENN